MKTTQFAVTGRVYGDDEDTLLILTLPDTADGDDAAKAFKAEMREIAKAEGIEEYEDVIVNTIVQGDNLARIL